MDIPKVEIIPASAVKIYEPAVIKGRKGFLPGRSGNPKGKPPGTKSYVTLFRDACKTIAKERGMNHKEIEAYLVAQGVSKALDGNFLFYKDTLDRLIGTAVQQGSMKITQELGDNAAQSLGDLYNLINEHYKRQDSRPLGEGAHKTLDRESGN